MGRNGSIRKDAPFSARKRGYGRGLVTRSIRSGGITVVAALASAVVVVAVVVVDLEPFFPGIEGGCSTSRTIVWSSLLSIMSRTDVDLRRIGIGRTEKAVVDTIVEEGIACDDDVARAACAIAVITSIDINFMVNDDRVV